MFTKKIWLWIFGGMFLVPEVLWSPIVNFYYQLFQSSYSSNVQPFRNNFFQSSDNLKYLKFVILLQAIGLLFFTISFITNKKNIKITMVKYLLIVIPLLILLFSVLFVLFFAFSFNPSIG